MALLQRKTSDRVIEHGLPIVSLRSQYVANIFRKPAIGWALRERLAMRVMTLEGSRVVNSTHHLYTIPRLDVKTRTSTSLFGH